MVGKYWLNNSNSNSFLAVQLVSIHYQVRNITTFTLRKTLRSMFQKALGLVAFFGDSLILIITTISNYWTRLSKISWFFSGEQINYLPSSTIVLSFDDRVCILRNIFGKWNDLPLPRKSDCKKEKSVVSFTHEQNSICSQKQLNDIAHEHTIICRQLFAGHVVGSQPMKRKKHLHGMIIIFIDWYCANINPGKEIVICALQWLNKMLES